MAVDMVVPAEVPAPAPSTVRQVEAAPAENLADALTSIQKRLKNIEKSAYRGGRGGRGGLGRGGNGWRFGSNNNNNHQSGNGGNAGNSDQRHENADARGDAQNNRNSE